MRSVTRGDITSTPSRGQFSALQGVGVPETVTTACPCTPVGMGTQSRTPTHAGADLGTATGAPHSLQGIFGVQKGLQGVVWGGAVSAAAKALTHSRWAVWAALRWADEPQQPGRDPLCPLAQPEKPVANSTASQIRASVTARHGARNKIRGNTRMLFAFLIPCICGWPKASLSPSSSLGTARQHSGPRSHPSPEGDKAAAVNHSPAHQKYPPPPNSSSL